MSDDKAAIAIARLEENVISIKEGLEGRKDAESVLFDKIDKMITKFENAQEGLEKKFAAKWVETTMRGAVAVILMSVLGAMIATIIPK